MPSPIIATLLVLLLAGCDDQDLTESGDTKGADTEREPYTWALCADPEPVLDPKGAATGWVRCANGGVNRVEAVPVDMALYAADVPECGEEWKERSACTTDAECVERPNGRCRRTVDWTGPYCVCTYLCSVDADCDAGEVCVTPEVPRGGGWPICNSALCLTNADCASGECGYTRCFENFATGRSGLACRTDADTCRVGDDCEWVGGIGGNWCAPTDGSWSCVVCTDMS
jgi:hypothetical protein